MTLAQQTYVPDDGFEGFLEANGMGNGILYDDYVTTSNINTVTTLSVNNGGIWDLTGIEGFILLNSLSCSSNHLTSLNVSNNTALTFLQCTSNYLTNLDVSNNTALTSLSCGDNQFTTIDVSGVTALTYLECGENTLTSLDVSNNTALTTLYCNSNLLTSLDARNGNNTNFFGFSCILNPNLSCINVNDVAWSTVNWINFDPQHYFSNNCSGTGIQEHSTTKKLLKVTGLLGRETKGTNQPLFYIYDDGTVEKKIIIE